MKKDEEIWKVKGEERRKKKDERKKNEERWKMEDGDEDGDKFKD